MSAVPVSQLAVVLHPSDNVAVATRNLNAGQQCEIGGQSFTVEQSIRFGHKFAIKPIERGQAVRKYGQTIGFATENVPVGCHVHVHNLSCDDFERDYAFSTEVPAPPVMDREYFFDGYLRPNGSVGTRNYVALVSTVNCSATVCARIAEKFRTVSKEYPNVDGVVALTHKTGCGMAAKGMDRQHLQRALGGFAKHANVFDYVIVGLGCEVNQAFELVEEQQLTAPASNRPRIITIQGAGGTQRAVDLGCEAVHEILKRANDCKRTRQPASRIILGTECGGSDGNSGITANPAVGVASDLIVAQGGTAILSETTEIYGAEHLLTRRAITPQVGQKLVDRIKWWNWYASVFGAELNNNPSHGNKDGGLSTIYEKSLGAVAKGGSTALVDVYEYAQPVTAKGFVVMDTPGFDPPSVTGMVAGGANVVVFTTGRGSAYGCKPVPCIKIATNTPLFEHMNEDMDVNAGVILDGVPVEQVGRQIFETIVAVASGEKTKSEIQGIGDEEFAPWTVGPVL